MCVSRVGVVPTISVDTSEQVDKNKCWSTRKRHMKERVAITDWLSAKKVSSKETSLCRGNKVNEPFVDEEDDIVLVKQIDTSKELNVKVCVCVYVCMCVHIQSQLFNQTACITPEDVGLTTLSVHCAHWVHISTGWIVRVLDYQRRLNES